MRLQISKLVAAIICFVATIPCFGSNPWMEDYTYIGSYNPGFGYCEVYGVADDEGYGVCIEIPDGLDSRNKFILIRDYGLTQFVSALLQVQNKYTKWNAVAKQNNVSEY